jgi:hypothetical protein
VLEELLELVHFGLVQGSMCIQFHLIIEQVGDKQKRRKRL